MVNRLNIADRLSESAKRWPNQIAVVQPSGRDSGGAYRYQSWTFAELDREASQIAFGLRGCGIESGERIVLMVRPSFEFIALTFGLMRAGIVVVLIDPGMGRSNIFQCLEEIDPAGFIAIPIVQAIRIWNRRRFPNARFNFTVGRRWLWIGALYEDLLANGARKIESSSVTDRVENSRTKSTDPAAIIFTSGSTGPPKGVVYEHGMFDAQVDLLRGFYGIQPGEVDLPGFPLFGLFNAAMGVTTVIPDMDPTKPARVDPVRMLAHMRDWKVTQAFGSPAIWNRIGRHCEATGETLPGTLRRVLSAGAPVPVHVIERMRRAFSNSEADMHTPYGATESLPVASISGREVLERTAPLSRIGKGTCVGQVFAEIEVKIVEITEGPIKVVADVKELPRGEIGEILVSGPSTTREYFRRPDATGTAKVVSDTDDRSSSFFHRMGDVGYLDDQNRLWFCGRKAHIVETSFGRMFTIPCEAIFNNHPRVFRSALVGVGSKPNQQPVIVVEPEAGQFPKSSADRAKFRDELLKLARDNPLTSSIHTVLFHPSLPVDIRHNVKIFREKLGPWVESELSKSEATSK